MQKVTIILIALFLIVLVALVGFNELLGLNKSGPKDKIIGIWERIEPQYGSVPYGTTFRYTSDGHVIPMFEYDYYWKYWFEEGYLYEHTYYAKTNEPTELGRQKFEIEFVSDDVFELVGGSVLNDSKAHFIFHRVK